MNNPRPSNAVIGPWRRTKWAAHNPLPPELAQVKAFLLAQPRLTKEQSK